MASGRIPYDPATPLGREISVMLQHGSRFRQAAHELSLKVGRYNDDKAAVSKDSGIDLGNNTQTFMDLLARTDGEMGGTHLVDAKTGEQGMTRTLLDSMA